MKLSLHSKNMLAIFGGDSVAKLLGFLATAYLARVLGEVGFGKIHIALAVLSYAILISSGGIPLMGTREIARNGTAAAQVTGELLFSRLLFSVLSFIILAVYAFFFQNDDVLTTLTIIYGLYVLPQGATLDWFFQGKSRLGIVAAGRTLQMAIYLLAVLIFVNHPDDIFAVAWMWVLAAGLNTGLLALFFIRQGHRIIAPSSVIIVFKSWFSALPLGTATILSQLILQFPFIYLDAVGSPATAGYYGVAFRLILAMLIIDRIFYTVFFPSISRVAGVSPDHLSAVFSSVMKVISFSAFFIAALAIAAAGWIIPLIFGGSYQPAVHMFQYLCLYFIGSFANSVVGFTLAGMGLHRAYSRSFIIAFIIAILTGWLFTKEWQITGMIIALGIYQWVALLANSFSLHSRISISWFRSLYLPLIAGLSGLVFLQLNSENGILIWPFLFLIYLPVLLWTAGFNRADFLFIKKALF